jgi:hypothetical protein
MLGFAAQHLDDAVIGPLRASKAVYNHLDTQSGLEPPDWSLDMEVDRFSVQVFARATFELFCACVLQAVDSVCQLSATSHNKLSCRPCLIDKT